MALKFFEASESNGTGNLDFLKDWIEANPKNTRKQFLITEVTLAQSAKGYCVKTSDFIVWLWRRSKEAKMLVEALDHYCKNPQSGFALYVVLPNPKLDKYKFAADSDEPTTWFTVGNGYTTTEPGYILEEENSGSNPLIVFPTKKK